MTSSRNPLILRSEHAGPMGHADVDQNFKNCARWAGEWVAGTYRQNQIVWHRGAFWIANTSTAAVPSTDGTWEPVGLKPGHGSMAGNNLGMGTIAPVTWFPIPYTSITIAGRGLTMTPATGQFVFNYPGVWSLSVVISFTLIDANFGRTYQIRLWDVTGSSELANITSGIGRNQDHATMSLTVLAVIPENQLGNVFRLELGGASDDIEITDFEASNLSLCQASV